MIGYGYLCINGHGFNEANYFVFESFLFLYLLKRLFVCITESINVNKYYFISTGTFTFLSEQFHFHKMFLLSEVKAIVFHTINNAVSKGLASWTCRGFTMDFVKMSGLCLDSWCDVDVVYQDIHGN